MQPRREKLAAHHFSGEAARKLDGAGTSGQGELAQALELGEIERQAVGPAETAQDAALQGDGLRLEERQVDARFGVQRRAEGGGDQIVEECVFGGGDFRGLAEGLAQLRVVIALQGGQELRAHAIAQKARTEVGGVVAKGLAEREQVALDLLAAGGEERADEARGRRGCGVGYAA